MRAAMTQGQGRRGRRACGLTSACLRFLHLIPRYSWKKSELTFPVTKENTPEIPRDILEAGRGLTCLLGKEQGMAGSLQMRSACPR